MALLPSGSRDDIELLRIEHKDFSLLIKGRPYHPHYEGLKQYQSMNSQDIMQFSVEGKNVESIVVYDVGQQKLIKPNECRPIFFENAVYQIIVIPRQKNKKLLFYHEHPLLRKAVALTDLGDIQMLVGSLTFQNEVGLTTFEIRDEKDTLIEVTLEIFPAKLDYRKDYQMLLEEVNEEIYNLAFHFIKKTYLSANIKLDGKPTPSEFYRLIKRHFHRFIQAVVRIERQPHHTLEKTYIRARGDQLSKTDTEIRKHLRKHTQVFMEVNNGIHINGKSLMPREGLKVKKEMVYDTFENRYVKWMMQRLIYKLDDLLDRIANQNKRWKQRPDLELVALLEDKRDQLQSKLKMHFWRNIGRLDRSVLSLVLQMAPGYRDAFQIYLMVSKGLMLQGKLYQMSVKDVATLYEYWTFLKLGQLLSKKYEQISQDIISVNRNGLFVNLETNRSAQRIFLHPITKEKIILIYQKYEGDLPTLAQKPDTMLTISKKGKKYKYNYVFDAKYRIDYAQEGSYYADRYKQAGPLEEDINTMHRYRDSIVTLNNGPYERTAFGAYVLFPWYDEKDYKNHHFYKSIDKVNIGGLPFLPNATDLVEQIIENIIEKSPDEIQQDGILPRGAKEDWETSLQEKVLVGLVPNENTYMDFMQNKYYKLPLKQTRRGWQEVKYIALYLKAGTSMHNGILHYAKIDSVTIDHVDGEDYIIFFLRYWNKLQQVIKPVNYGIASYMITNLSQLKEAKELPELYMKSKQEMTLWRILRRITDHINIKLDHHMLDSVREVNSFTFEDVSIQIDHIKQVLVVTGYNKDKQEIDISLLSNKPSSVFKTIISFLQ